MLITCKFSDNVSVILDDTVNDSPDGTVSMPSQPVKLIIPTLRNVVGSETNKKGDVFVHLI